MFSPSIAGSVGKTVTKHLTKLPSGMNFPGFTFVGEAVEIGFFPHQQQIALNPNYVVPICFHTGFENTGQPSSARWRVFASLCLRDLGFNVLVSYFEGRVKLN